MRSGSYVKRVFCKFSLQYQCSIELWNTLYRKSERVKVTLRRYTCGGMGWISCEACWRAHGDRRMAEREVDVLNCIGSRVALDLHAARDWASLRRPLRTSSADERRRQESEPPNHPMSSNQGQGESPPSARPSMSAPPDQGPLALFDLYLRILSDSYLTFLHERFVHGSPLALV